MIVVLSGVRHRLFFEFEAVPARYNGPAKRTKALKRTIKNEEGVKRTEYYTLRTVCKLQVEAGLDENQRTIWKPVAERAVYLSHEDRPTRYDGRVHAFRALMDLDDVKGFGYAVRAQLADQFFAQLPKRRTYNDIRKENAKLRAAIAKLTDVAKMNSAEYLESLIGPGIAR